MNSPSCAIVTAIVIATSFSAAYYVQGALFVDSIVLFLIAGELNHSAALLCLLLSHNVCVTHFFFIKYSLINFI